MRGIGYVWVKDACRVLGQLGEARHEAALQYFAGRVEFPDAEKEAATAALSLMRAHAVRAREVER